MTLNKNLKNILSLFSVEFLSKLIGFVALTYLARVLSKSSFGIVNIGLAALSYTVIISNSGLNQLGTRELITGRKNIQQFISDMLSARLLISGIVYLAAAIIVILSFPSQEIIQVILLYNLFLFPTALLLEWFFYAYQKISIISYGRIIGMVVYAVLIFLTVTHLDDYVRTGIAWLAGGICNTLILLYSYRKTGHSIHLTFSLSRTILLLKESLPLGTATIIAQVVVMFPILYLGFIATPAEAGTYSAAYRVIILFLVFDRIFINIFFPKIAKCFTETPDQLPIIFNKVLKIVATFAFSFSLIGIICAAPIVMFIFGNQFFDAIIIFQILLGYFALTLINSVLAFTFIGMNLERVYAYAVLWGMGLFLLSTILLTEYIGILGSAMSMIVFELTALLYMSMKMLAKIPFDFIRNLVLPSLALIGCITMVLSLRLPFAGQVITAIMFGVPALFTLIGFSNKEIEFIKRVLG